MLISDFSFYRLRAVFLKELIQLLRDRITFVIILLIPLVQVILLGMVINSDPKQLPTVLIDRDNTPYSRELVTAMKNTQYFNFTHQVTSKGEADKLLAKGKVLFVVNIPEDFAHDIVRNLRPQVLVEADATNPMATSNPLKSINTIETLLADPHFLQLPTYSKRPINATTPFQFVISQKYNQAALPHYFSVPGVIGLTLSMTMLIMTLIAITTEIESGTMESLLTTPVRPIEVVIGKITPFIFIAYLQICGMLAIAKLVFAIPFRGSILLLLASAFPFIISSLMVGLTISVVAQKQFRAIQFANIFSLINVLFSGFVFPFQGMPIWGQWIGEALPLTHFLRILSGIMLKQNNFVEIWHSLWPLLIAMLVTMSLSVKTYKRSLD